MHLANTSVQFLVEVSSVLGLFKWQQSLSLLARYSLGSPCRTNAIRVDMHQALQEPSG